METLFVFLNVQLYISLHIDNLQMLLEIGLLKKKEEKRKEIKIALSLGYTNSCFYDKRCNMLLLNGYIYHFLDYIKLLFVNANVIIILIIII